MAEMTPGEYIRNGIQQLLDLEGDGYQLDEFVLCLALQRMGSDGRVESTMWVWSPHEQADWKTDGLLRAALELRCDLDIDND